MRSTCILLYQAAKQLDVREPIPKPKGSDLHQKLLHLLNSNIWDHPFFKFFTAQWWLLSLKIEMILFFTYFFLNVNTFRDQQTKLYILAWKSPQSTHHTHSIKCYVWSGLLTSKQNWNRQWYKETIPTPAFLWRHQALKFMEQNISRGQDTVYKNQKIGLKKSLNYLTLDRKKSTKLPEIANLLCFNFFHLSVN